MRPRVIDLFCNLLSQKEIKFFELFDWFAVLHAIKLSDYISYLIINNLLILADHNSDNSITFLEGPFLQEVEAVSFLLAVEEVFFQPEAEVVSFLLAVEEAFFLQLEAEAVSFLLEVALVLFLPEEA